MSQAIVQELRRRFDGAAAGPNPVEISAGELRAVFGELERLERWDAARVQVIHNLHEDLNDLRLRLSRMEDAAVKLLEYADESDSAQYGTLGSSLVRTLLKGAMLVESQPSSIKGVP
jgi:hypothetical protein